jgi:hypothetical protein
MNRDIEIVLRIFKEVKDKHKSDPLLLRDDLDMAQFVSKVNQVLTSTWFSESSRERMIKAMTLILHQIYVRDLEEDEAETGEPDWFKVVQEEIAKVKKAWDEEIENQVEPKVYTFGCCECDRYGNCNGSC